MNVGELNEAMEAQALEAWDGDYALVRLLNDMENTPLEFHIGGSWYFGCARPDSDIDFLAEDSPELIDFLTKRGFTRMGGDEAEYAIPETQTRGVYQNGKVQVQVIRSRAFKATLRARDILATHFAAEHKEAGKYDRRGAWTALIDALITVESFLTVSLPF